MFQIECPWCGLRDQREYSCGGEAHIVRPQNPDELTDAQWGDYVYMRTNTKGVYAEQWCHSHGCHQWFNVLKNTATDEIYASYQIGEKPPEVKTAKLPQTPSGEPELGSGYNAWETGKKTS